MMNGGCLSCCKGEQNEVLCFQFMVSGRNRGGNVAEKREKMVNKDEFWLKQCSICVVGLRWPDGDGGDGGRFGYVRKFVLNLKRDSWWRL